MAGLVEEVVEPGPILAIRGEVTGIEVEALGRGATLQVDHLEAKDRGKPRAEGGLAAEAADAFQGRQERLLHRLLRELAVAQL